MLEELRTASQAVQMIYRFADCTLDVDAHVLTRGAETVHVEPQVFDLLATLARAGQALVSYDDLIAQVWQGRIVSDATMAARISSARTAVGDDGKRQAIIRTISRRGVQMAVAVDSGAQAPRQPEIGGTEQQVIRYVSSADGIRIAYGISGQGPKMLRVGHWLTHLDLDWSSPVWRPLLDRLGQNFTVYRYDQRGTGLSDRDYPGKGIDEFVGDLVAVADAMEVERVPIFTASQGVSIALKFAATYPDRAGPMVLYAGFSQGRYHRGIENARQEAETYMAMIRSGWGKPGSPFMDLFSTLFMPDATEEQSQSFIEMQLASAEPDGAAKLRHIIDNFDVSDILGQVKVPVLLAHCREDRVHPADQSRTMARHIDGAELVTFDGRNHVPLPHTPAWEALMQEAIRFLNTHLDT